MPAGAMLEALLIPGAVGLLICALGWWIERAGQRRHASNRRDRLASASIPTPKADR